MPIEYGFLQRRYFCLRRFASAHVRRLRLSSLRQLRPTRPLVRREKNYAPEAVAGVLTASARRKTRESAPTDSPVGVLCRRARRFRARGARDFRFCFRLCRTL